MSIFGLVTSIDPRSLGGPESAAVEPNFSDSEAYALPSIAWEQIEVVPEPGTYALILAELGYALNLPAVGVATQPASANSEARPRAGPRDRRSLRFNDDHVFTPLASDSDAGKGTCTRLAPRGPEITIRSA